MEVRISLSVGLPIWTRLKYEWQYSTVYVYFKTDFYRIVYKYPIQRHFYKTVIISSLSHIINQSFTKAQNNNTTNCIKQ